MKSSFGWTVFIFAIITVFFLIACGMNLETGGMDFVSFGFFVLGCLSLAAFTTAIFYATQGGLATVNDLAYGVEFRVLSQSQVTKKSETGILQDYWLITIQAQGNGERVINIERSKPFDSNVITFTKLKNGSLLTRERSTPPRVEPEPNLTATANSPAAQPSPVPAS